jgi:hypothetical protein
MSKSSAFGPPKRPPTAYMMFTSERRQKAKEDNPHSTFGELGKILGELWAKLPDPQKSVSNFSLIFIFFSTCFRFLFFPPFLFFSYPPFLLSTGIQRKGNQSNGGLQKRFG